MTYSTHYQPGAWNAVCSMCGQTFKSTELRKHWQGLRRCDRCWEPRHPQDFVRARPEERSPPWTQPEQTDNFVLACTPNGQSAVPGFAVPGCAVPGHIHPFFDPTITD